MSRLFVSRIRRRLILEWDALKWLRGLRKFKSRQDSAQRCNGTVLICDLLSMIGGAKVEAIYAGALKTQGYKTVVVLNHPEPIVEKLYRAAASDVEFVYFSKVSKEIDSSIIEKEVDAILARCDGSFAALKNFQLSGIRIGKNSLSLAIRQLREGHLNLSNYAHVEAIKGALKCSLIAAKAASRIISEVKPQRALFNERGYSPSGEMFDLCLLSGCQVVQWFAAPKSHQLLFKRYSLKNRSEHPMSLSDETWRLIKENEWSGCLQEKVKRSIQENYDENAAYNRQKLQMGKKKFSEREVIKKIGLDPCKKTAVIFTHILYDATFFYGESLFDDYQHWLIEAVRSAIANPSLNWVVKVHPVNLWRSKMDGAKMEQLEEIALTDNFGELPPHIKIMGADTDINTASLFEVMDYALTVRGTIGMEAPCLGVPVVTAGSGRYSGKGFTIDPSSPQEFRNILSELHNIPRLSTEEIELATKHYYATLILRPQNIESFTINFHSFTYGLKDLAMDCFVSTGLRRSGEFGDDLSRFVKWFDTDTDLDLVDGFDVSSSMN